MEVLGELLLADQPQTADGRQLVIGEGVLTITSGTTAQRLAPGNNGSVYLDTTLNKLYYDNGTVWSEYAAHNIASVGFGALTGTTTIPTDATIPLSTEGTQICTLSITPRSTASKIKLSTSLFCDCGTNGRSVTFAIFRGTTCIQAVNTYVRTNTQPMSVSMLYLDSPASAAAQTYSLRVGVNSAASWYVNQNATRSITYGGTANRSTFIAEET